MMRVHPGYRTRAWSLPPERCTAEVLQRCPCRGAAGATDECAGSLPSISSVSDGAMLKGISDRTQGLEIQVLRVDLDVVSHTDTMGLRFIICDDFGVDHHDLYSPGLISFWVLPHERRGYRPFINETLVEPTISDRV